MTQLTHEKVLISTGPRSGLPVIVAVHSTVLGQAVGGCRLWTYDEWQDGLADALRLSSAMTWKCSLAGLPLGGGKSVLAIPPGTDLTEDLRRAVFHDLGDLVESLGGSYGVGEDVGTTAQDMATVAERTAFAYGLPETQGGMGETSEPTAAGVFASILVTAEEVWGNPDLDGRRVAVLGMGQVGSRLATRLRAAGATLVVSDIDPAKRGLTSTLEAEWLDPEAILEADADLLVPAALGGLLTPSTVPALNCRRRGRPRQQPAVRQPRRRADGAARDPLGARLPRERRRRRLRLRDGARQQGPGDRDGPGRRDRRHPA